jgi:hypothetical protein
MPEDNQKRKDCPVIELPHEKPKTEFKKGIISLGKPQITLKETMQAIEDFCQGKTLSPDTEDRLPTHEEACKALDDFYSKLPQIPDAFTQMQFHLKQLGVAMTVAADNYQKCVRKCVEHHVDNQKYLVQPLVMAEQSVDDLREELVDSIKKTNRYHRLWQKDSSKAKRYLKSLLHTNSKYLKFRNNEWRLARSKSILDDALLSLECCYDSDGNSMKHSDSAVKLRAAIKLIKEF